MTTNTRTDADAREDEFVALLPKIIPAVLLLFSRYFVVEVGGRPPSSEISLTEEVYGNGGEP